MKHADDVLNGRELPLLEEDVSRKCFHEFISIAPLKLQIVSKFTCNFEMENINFQFVRPSRVPTFFIPSNSLIFP